MMNDSRFSENEQTRELKERIKKAFHENDLWGILQGGFEGFMRLVFSKPVMFAQFLQETGEYCDQIILKACEEEKLTYIGGKLKLAMTAASDDAIQMQAEMFFQDQNRQWVQKKAEGKTHGKDFVDWDTEPNLMRLRKERNLEYPIENPLVK